MNECCLQLIHLRWTPSLPCDHNLCAVRACSKRSFSTEHFKTRLHPRHCICIVGLRKDCSHIGDALFVLCEIIVGIKCKRADPKRAIYEPKLVENSIF